jgi:hypothetical protein
MSVIETLLETAYLDNQLLSINASLGDDASVLREVDFMFRSHEKEKLETLESLIQDNQYGVSRIESDDYDFRVIVTINMPMTQHLICSVSALMACLSEIFAVEYDGWECPLPN